MRREDLSDLSAFLAVAEEQSFTRAAARLGTSQSALSHTLNRVEARLGVRLLTRTTRRVSPTEAGERLLQTLRPAFDDIDAGLAGLSELRDRPAGSLRIVASENAARGLLWPKLADVLPRYPDLKVEINVDAGLTDIVAERFDAGVRLGEHLAKDMIAVRIGPDLRLAVVGSPAYFDRHPRPRTPQDLAHHLCINLRLESFGGLYAWEFEKDGRELRVRVDGQFTSNDVPLILEAARGGTGLACVLEDQVMPSVANGSLVRVLEDWCAPFSGYHLYYPSRRQQTPAFALLVEALRYRE
ncbi:LysR family transcriptional regulator [Sphingomonas tabacisoli]|uniref:LysR family transcriptional regulator n=1 Tax=Sphingomonas tabacisoli TaxID=2249466 RepID=A0ABW4I5S0_9SPHN